MNGNKVACILYINNKSNLCLNAFQQNISNIVNLIISCKQFKSFTYFLVTIEIGTRGTGACAHPPPQDFAINKEVPFQFIENDSFFLRKKCPWSVLPPSLRWFLRPCLQMLYWKMKMKQHLHQTWIFPFGDLTSHFFPSRCSKRKWSSDPGSSNDNTSDGTHCLLVSLPFAQTYFNQEVKFFAPCQCGRFMGGQVGTS